MDVYWLDQTEADVPAENDWLSASEADYLKRLRFAKRRADWRLGRWTAKRALAAYLQLPGRSFQTFARIEIRSAPSGAPRAFVANEPAAAISLSHRAGEALCFVSPIGTSIGCDLEIVEPRSGAFISDFFTNEEQAMVARVSAADRPCLVALLWSGKESALKALGAGLRLDTRTVVVTPVDGWDGQDQTREGFGREEGTDPAAFTLRHLHAHYGWHPLRVLHMHGQVFQGWWQHTGKLLRTIVAVPPPTPPIRLRIPPQPTPKVEKIPWDQYQIV